MIAIEPLCLVTDRVILQPLQECHKHLYTQLYTSKELMHFVMTPLSIQKAEASFKQAIKMNKATPWQRLFLAVEDKYSGQPLGLVGLSSVDWVDRSVEFGILLMKHAQGLGLSSEILQAVMQSLFTVFSMRTVWLELQKNNAAAVHMAMSAGMELRCDGSSAIKQIWYKTSSY
ncbi:MAG: GNAT family N-acetyltransferase [Alkalimonas sp.]|nr:GNAT family N-acetyltransferase [Alkalimonas sp.]